MSWHHTGTPWLPPARKFSSCGYFSGRAGAVKKAQVAKFQILSEAPCGVSSAVERYPSKLDVVGSIPDTPLGIYSLILNLDHIRKTINDIISKPWFNYINYLSGGDNVIHTLGKGKQYRLSVEKLNLPFKRLMILLVFLSKTKKER